MPQRIRVAVVGAGPAGLCVAKHLIGAAAGYDVSVFEQDREVGGTWVYSEDIDNSETGRLVQSSMYANLRTNLSKEIMAFPEFPFAAHLPSFLGREDVRRYLHDYAVHYGVAERTRLGTEVVDVRPLQDHTDDVTAAAVTSSPASPSPCSTTTSPPMMSSASRTPSLADGAVDGRQTGKISAVDDRSCGPLTALGTRWQLTHRVAGDSGAEASTQEFDAVFVCNGHNSKPVRTSLRGMEHFRGAALHSHNYRRPDSYRDQTVVVVGCGASGQDICLDVAAHARRVLVSASKEKWMVSRLPGNVEQVPRIDRVDADGRIVFGDGSAVAADTIIWCTGYAYSYPFLNHSCGITVDSASGRHVQPLYKHLVNALHPTMMFIGVPYTVVPFPFASLQAQYGQAVLDGRHALPSRADMARWQDDDLRRRLRLGYKLHEAHRMAEWQFEYARDMARCAGVEPLPAHTKPLYDHIMTGRKYHLVRYRNESYRVRDDESRGDDGKLFNVVPLDGAAAAEE